MAFLFVKIHLLVNNLSDVLALTLTPSIIYMYAGGDVMAYPGYNEKTKLEIVKRIWKGAKVAPLSRRFGVSRDLIHRWINELNCLRGG